MHKFNFGEQMKKMQNTINQQDMNKMKKIQNLAQKIHLLNQKRKGIQFFNLVADQSRAIYLDQQKQFVVVKIEYLRQLQSLSDENKKSLDVIQEKMKNEHIQKAAFNKVIDLKNEQIQFYKQQYEVAKKKNQQLQQNMKMYEGLLNQKDNYLDSILKKNQLFNIHQQNTKNSNANQNIQSTKQQKSVQTILDFRLPQNQANKNIQIGSQSTQPQNKPLESVSNKQQILINKYEEEIKKLKQNFENVLDNLSNKMQNKINEMQKQKMGIQQWKQKNDYLLAQNARLRQQLKNTDLQKVKVEAWQRALKDLVGDPDAQYSSVFQGQRTYEPYSKQNGGPKDSKYMQDIKVKMMQTTLDRLQSQKRLKQQKLLQIKNLINSTEESSISEQNIVDNLLTLSRKIKEVVKFLLQQL